MANEDLQFRLGLYGPGTPFSQFLSTGGDGTGQTNANGDYSTEAAEFLIRPNERTGILYVWRILITVRDGAPFNASGYGGIGAGLNNGVSLLWQRRGELVNDFMDGVPVKANADYARQMCNLQISSFGAGDDYLAAICQMSGFGKPVTLDPSKGDTLGITFTDDLSGLVQHYFLVQGWHR